MKGDFTRDSFRPDKHFQQVLMQQGRVQLDADWNEQAAIVAHRDAAMMADLVGPSGGPAEGAAFRILPNFAVNGNLPGAGDFYLSPGRYYVDGILCELEQPVLFSKQPHRRITRGAQGTLESRDFESYRLTFPEIRERASANSMQIAEVELLGVVNDGDITMPGDPIQAISDNQPSREEASPDAERVANAIDDRDITKYLNFDGTDKVTGLIVTPRNPGSRVIGLALTSANDAPGRDPAKYQMAGTFDGRMFHVISEGDVEPFENTEADPPSNRLSRQVIRFREPSSYLVFLDVWQRHVSVHEDAELREPALGGPDTTSRVQTVWQVRTALIPRWSPASPCQDPAPLFDRLARAELPRLAARTFRPDDNVHPCILPSAAGYRGLENQLYRVEIHARGVSGTATYKWSRENGSVVSRIEGNVALPGGPDANQLRVGRAGPDSSLGFAPEDLVEILHESDELESTPGFLARVAEVHPESGVITLKPVPEEARRPSLVRTDDKPRLRRWEGLGIVSIETAVSDGFLALENGIEIRFTQPEGAEFRTGDYWLIPARAATPDAESGKIDWPGAADSPEPVPPRGITHHYARLGIVTVDNANTITQVFDARRLWRPMTAGGHDGLALRIEGIEWNDGPDPGTSTPVVNHGRIPRDLLERGLTLRCSQPLDPVSVLDPLPSTDGRVRRGQPNCFVTAEVPEYNQTGSLIAYRLLRLHATVDLTPDHTGIQWTPDPGAFAALTSTTDPNARQPDGVLLRLTLKGNHIRARRPNPLDQRCSPSGFLDGEAFSGGGENGEGLLFPSGDGLRGGDFEMWFWFTSLVSSEPEQPPSIQVESPVDFGTVRIGQRPVRNIGIHNVGDGVLVISEFNIRPGRFTIDRLGGEVRISKGNPLTLQATFAPRDGDSGTFEAVLGIISNDPRLVVSVILRGSVQSGELRP